MLNNKNSYIGQQMQPQRRTYPTAGLLNSGPAVSPVTPPTTPKGVTAPGSVVFDPPAPTAPVHTPPPVGPAAPEVPALNDPSQSPGYPMPQTPTPRQKLTTAIMNRGGSEV